MICRLRLAAPVRRRFQDVWDQMAHTPDAVGWAVGVFLDQSGEVPMRVGGAVASVVPVVGNPVHDAIDTAADAVDSLPF